MHRSIITLTQYKYYSTLIFSSKLNCLPITYLCISRTRNDYIEQLYFYPCIHSFLLQEIDNFTITQSSIVDLINFILFLLSRFENVQKEMVEMFCLGNDYNFRKVRNVNFACHAHKSASAPSSFSLIISSNMISDILACI